MDQSIAIEEIAVLLQWQYPILPHELWLVIVHLRLSFLPQNHPVFLHLIASVKRAWFAHFRCIELHANLVLFLPDPRIKLKKAVLGHIARRNVTVCWSDHSAAGLDIRFTGRKRDEQRMLQRTQNVLLGDPRRDYVYRASYSHYWPQGLLVQTQTPRLLTGVYNLPRWANTCYCMTCHPSLDSFEFWRDHWTLPCQHIANCTPRGGDA